MDVESVPLNKPLQLNMVLVTRASNFNGYMEGYSWRTLEDITSVPEAKTLYLSLQVHCKSSQKNG